jgi:putative SOS response-associated peptidase YedK
MRPDAPAPFHSRAPAVITAEQWDALLDALQAELCRSDRHLPIRPGRDRPSNH